MEISLKYPYISVRRQAGLSYGGSQAWSKRKFWRESACGLVSGTDLLLYLEHRQEADGLPEQTYLDRLEHLGWRYFPVLPKIGIVGWFLSAGLNAYFMRHRIPLKSSWGVWHWKLWKRMEEMLRADIPVILAIGPNFPFRWSGHKLNLYTKGTDGKYRVTARTSGHYVNVTGMDAEWLRIASWGREYYIRRAEYWDYARKYSLFLTCNIAYVRAKKRGEGKR